MVVGALVAIMGLTNSGLVAMLPVPSVPKAVTQVDKPLPPEPSTKLLVMTGVELTLTLLMAWPFPQMMLLRMCGLLMLLSIPPPAAALLPLRVTLLSVGLLV